jgi:hypothetical protein
MLWDELNAQKMQLQLPPACIPSLFLKGKESNRVNAVY